MKLTVWPLLVLQPPLGTVPQFAIVIPAPDCVLLYGNIKATQPQFQPALLRLSAMTSQYFIAKDSASFVLHTAMTKSR